MANKMQTQELLYAEEVCKILHISKRKCSWMLQNGSIPCKDTGKKTHRYLVLRHDLDEYIKDSEQHPEKYFIPVTFTSNNPGKRDPSKKYEPDKYYIYKYSECKLVAATLESDFTVKKGAKSDALIDFLKFYNEIAEELSKHDVVEISSIERRIDAIDEDLGKLQKEESKPVLAL